METGYGEFNKCGVNCGGYSCLRDGFGMNIEGIREWGRERGRERDGEREG